MNVIFLSRREGKARQLNLARPRTLGIVAGVALSVLGLAFVMGMELGRGRTTAAGVADIDSREFNFDREPSSGGPEGEGEGVSAQAPDLNAMFSQLEQRVDSRESELSALENVILTRQLKAQIHPEGRPVSSGFISSYFGERADPFDGR